MKQSPKTRKCVTCGHPWNKHTGKPNRGCTVRYLRKGSKQFTDCSCRYFREEAN